MSLCFSGEMVNGIHYILKEVHDLTKKDNKLSVGLSFEKVFLGKSDSSILACQYLI